MEQYILKSAIVAEIERIKNTEYNGNSISDDVACCALDAIIDAINALEAKEVGNAEYWLVSVRYVLNGCNCESNCYFSYFPAKQDIQNTIGAERYTILHMQNLTEEQFNKLMGR